MAAKRTGLKLQQKRFGQPIIDEAYHYIAKEQEK